jgi:hypothetical protein
MIDLAMPAIDNTGIDPGCEELLRALASYGPYGTS